MIPACCKGLPFLSFYSYLWWHAFLVRVILLERQGTSVKFGFPFHGRLGLLSTFKITMSQMHFFSGKLSILYLVLSLYVCIVCMYTRVCFTLQFFVYSLLWFPVKGVIDKNIFNMSVVFFLIFVSFAVYKHFRPCKNILNSLYHILC